MITTSWSLIKYSNYSSERGVASELRASDAKPTQIILIHAIWHFRTILLHIHWSYSYTLLLTCLDVIICAAAIFFAIGYMCANISLRTRVHPRHSTKYVWIFTKLRKHVDSIVFEMSAKFQNYLWRIGWMPWAHVFSITFASETRTNATPRVLIDNSPKFHQW